MATNVLKKHALSYPQHGSRRFLQKVVTYPLNYMALHARRP
jgi:hypothetical protein